MNSVTVQDLTRRSAHVARLVRRGLSLAMPKLGLRSHGISVVLINDARMKSLNRRFRGIDRPTDVLSFESGETSGKQTLLGDIAISVPTARAQAKKAGKTQKGEFLLLSIHGLLHLLGYDHATAADEKRMFALQDDLVRRVIRHV